MVTKNRDNTIWVVLMLFESSIPPDQTHSDGLIRVQTNIIRNPLEYYQTLQCDHVHDKYYH